MMRNPEAISQTVLFTPMNSVETFNSKVNMNTVIANALTILTGFHLSLSSIDPPTMTGITGNTHGVNIVKMPAKKDRVSRNIERKELF
jgi:hypothetical protein